MTAQPLPPGSTRPIGQCLCGCGKRTAIAQKTEANRGYGKGDPKRYVRGHHPKPPTSPAQAPAEAVARYVTVAAPDACWPWRGTIGRQGYGVVSLSDRQCRANRVAYEVAKGPIPAGLVVRHTCDNPPCCNPAHLILGTHKDNAADRVQRQRQPVGERAYQARMTERDVLAIRARHAAGESIAALAREYGLNESTVGQAARGRTWKHLGGAA